MKREVADDKSGFSVENVRFMKLGDSHCTLRIEGTSEEDKAFYAYLCPDISMSGFMFVET